MSGRSQKLHAIKRMMILETQYCCVAQLIVMRISGPAAGSWGSAV